jgi:hypothetical protein
MIAELKTFIKEEGGGGWRGLDLKSQISKGSQPPEGGFFVPEEAANAD